MLRTSLRASYWRFRLARWNRRPTTPEPGYTLLLPVPGDIPVFCELALKVCSRQAARHRRRTLVIPDRPSPTVTQLVEKTKPGWQGELEAVLLPRPERWFLPFMNSGSRNHGLQVVKGISVSSTSHVIFHDADLFLLDDDFLDGQYETCRDRELECLGVSPVWDPWYETKGLRLAATWEMVASVPWLRAFPPYRQIGHDGKLFGEVHTFDTTLYAQSLTPGYRVDWVDRSADFVHFNYVITAYRHFQRLGPGFVDDHFRLLLIALFVDLFSEESPPQGLPTLAELADGIGDAAAPVRYVRDEAHASRWAGFRAQLDRVLGAEYVAAPAAAEAVTALSAFDQFYGAGAATGGSEDFGSLP
ncbi:MAG TPA: hypothetical protein VKI19_11150 [Acidimicrobiales bacterium]|nr:hypothetical protein [Acidimicrobiales bacterium]